jgi:preprotein translocase subunit SecE
MALAPYKEGQGIWVRGVMATTVFVVALYAAFRLYDWLLVEPNSFLGFLVQDKWVVPFIGWTLDLRLVPVAVLLFGFLGFGVWAYNYPRLVDFLVETENELRSRVTWPTKKELVNASTVVIVVAVVIGVWVLVSDWFFILLLRRGIYRMWFD